MDYRMCLEKARWVGKYVEAIRVEKTGREIYHKRFLLKVGAKEHGMRMKTLENQMVATVKALDALQNRAFVLFMAGNPRYEWDKECEDFLSHVVHSKGAAEAQETGFEIWLKQEKLRIPE
ncbi:hypothetical protein VKT23_007925 [Stygiomarasmius scandens]|uniref:Uncharacterized protein n=1 Tax=Marasmiellus scandens TaxID=2682957 RepID=A0ABR1JLB6_9AGAR